MSPPSPTLPSAGSSPRELARLAIDIGARLRDERIRRRWSVRQLAERARLSAAVVYAVESGRPASLETYVRLCSALGVTLGFVVADQRRRSLVAASPLGDFVHAAMGELEAARLSQHGFTVGLDEPFQHYQFAGRCDVVAWYLKGRALLHLENRTRFPNIQEVAGAWNAKRAYFAESLAMRLGVPAWASVTHVMVALWSAEVMHVVRLRTTTFRALCSDPPDAFLAWWAGSPPDRGRTSTMILLDPAAEGRQRLFCTPEDGLRVRPRHRGYAEAAAALRRQRAR